MESAYHGAVAASGVDPTTGRELTPEERVLRGAGALVGSVGAARNRGADQLMGDAERLARGRQTPPGATTEALTPEGVRVRVPSGSDELESLTNPAQEMRRATDADAVFTRPISWPSPRHVSVDMNHILSGHQQGGARLAPGNQKSLFPEDWSAETIERAVREAYRTADRVLERQGSRVQLEGSARGWRIQFWYDTVEREIKTAYPNRADIQGGR